MISVFMVIKNGISQGYPFIESIKSALPLADEFLISDGYSNDNTYETLVKCFGSEKKIKLFRDEWDKKSINGSAIRNALNKVRYRCKYDYILEVDANEIIPQQDIDIIKELPSIHPEQELFGFPYYQIIGSKIKFNEEFRYRLARNFSDICVLYDGYTFGFKYTLMDLKSRRTVRRLKSRFTSMIAEGRQIGLAIPQINIYLEKPIFRYYSIFPYNFFEKMKSKEYLQPTKDYNIIGKNRTKSPFKELYDQYTIDLDYVKFWDDVYELLKILVKRGYKFNKEFLEKRIINEIDQPDIIRSHFGKTRYEPICEYSI